MLIHSKSFFSGLEIILKPIVKGREYALYAKHGRSQDFFSGGGTLFQKIFKKYSKNFVKNFVKFFKKFAKKICKKNLQKKFAKKIPKFFKKISNIFKNFKQISLQKC